MSDLADEFVRDAAHHHAYDADETHTALERLYVALLLRDVEDATRAIQRVLNGDRARSRMPDTWSVTDYEDDEKLIAALAVLERLADKLG